MSYVTDDGEVVGWDENDPASLESWFGPFGHAEHLRKVVLASCREAVRAKYALAGEKITVDRTDDLARLSDKYVSYLIETLNGRRLRERNVLASAGY
jgi:hypothetical protein